MAEQFVTPSQLGDGGAPFTNPVTLSYAKREVTMHTVTAGELDTVASLSNSVHLALFGVSGGGLIAFAITLGTVTFTSPILAAGFVAATMISGLGSLFFGVMARISYKEAQRKLEEIKSSAKQTSR